MSNRSNAVKVWLLLAGGGLTAQTAGAQDVPSVSARDFNAEVSGTRIVASQGRDESLQQVTVSIWGRLRDPDRFRALSVQLDEDPELEFVVISRNEGSGPYYRLQIVASRPFGILTWSYPSCGMPQIAAPRVALGHCEGGTGAAGTAAPELRWYRLGAEGLVRQ